MKKITCYVNDWDPCRQTHNVVVKNSLEAPFTIVDVRQYTGGA